MNQKSKAFELIEFVWNNEKTDSYVRVNTTMYKAVILAIISQMEFNKNDFKNIYAGFSGCYWFGVNSNGKGVGNHTLTGFPDMAQASGRTDKIQSSFPKRTDLFKMQET